MKSRLTYVVVVIVLCAGMASFVHGRSPATDAAKPAFSHVFVVVLENQNYDNVVGSPSMPYLNSLIGKYGLATNYYGNAHPSIGNYFMLTTGKTITNRDDFRGTVDADNLARVLSAAGKTWKVYAQSLPQRGWLSHGYPYSKHHNPFAYFTDVIRDKAQAANMVPYEVIQNDLASGNLPNYALLVPDKLNDAHDCPDQGRSCSDADKRAGADRWMSQNLPALLDNAEFRRSGVLIVTFDEATDADKRHGGGHIATVVVSERTPAGFKSSKFYQHESALATTLELLGVNGRPGASAGAPVMTEFFTGR